MSPSSSHLAKTGSIPKLGGGCRFGALSDWEEGGRALSFGVDFGAGVLVVREM